MYFGSNNSPILLRSHMLWIAIGGIAIGCFMTGMAIGYNAPRDVELESTRPLTIFYELPASAVPEMMLKVSRDLRGICSAEAAVEEAN